MGRAIVNIEGETTSANSSRTVSGSIGTLTSNITGRTQAENPLTGTTALEGRAIVNITEQPSVNKNSLLNGTTNEGEIISTRKKLYSKSQYEKVIDTKFSQLVTPSEPVTFDSIDTSVSEFFQTYNQLFYSIPKFGEINSHEYLIKTSTEYIDFTPINNDIQALIEEINLLQKQNLELNQQIIQLQTTGSD